MTLPSQFRCTSAGDFIGPARDSAASIERMVSACKKAGLAPIKLLLLGSPGIGKSELAEHFCQLMGVTKWATHKYNGVQFKIDDAEELARTVRFTNLFGDWRIIRIEEVDRVPTVAQVRLLTLLDDLPPGNALIATSNCSVHDLESRFQSRFQVIQLKPPTAEEIVCLLHGRWQITTSIARQIATLACGNVRQALLDAQSYVTA